MIKKLRILALLRKELYVNLQDKKVRISLLAPPIIQLFLFTFAATLDVSNVSIAFYNRDEGQKSFEIIERFEGSPTFTNVTFIHNVAEMDDYIDQQKGIMVVSIDEAFSRNIEAGKKGEIGIILDGRKSNSAQIVLGYALSILEQYESEISLQKPKTEIVSRSWFNPNLYYYWYNIPSLVATLAMLICITVTSMSLAREKELGTYDQLLISPLSPKEMLFGKILPGIIIGIAEGMLMAFVGVFILGVPFTGSILLFVLSLFLYIFSVSGIGIFISTISSTQQQAMLGAFFVLAPAILLSGFATPIENMPSWLQPITYINPLRYMLIISKGLFLKDMPLSMVLYYVWPLIPIGLLNLLGAGIFFKRRLFA